MTISIQKIFTYTKTDIARLLADEVIVRNRRKIESDINNTKRFLETKKEFKVFDSYV